MRTLLARSLVVAVAATGIGMLGAAPAFANHDVCSNQSADQNYFLYPYRIGVDDPLTGYPGVVAVCVENTQTGTYYFAGGGGVWVRPDGSGGYTVTPMQCNSETCWAIF